MHSMIRVLQAIHRFTRLAGRDRWLILESSFFLLCAKIATLTTSTRTLLALGRLDLPLESSHPQLVSLPPEIAPAVSALDKSSRRLTFANCLTRAIALRMLLARRDIPTQLHIGARKDEHGEFAAHAWLTYQGIILVGGDDANELYREIVGSHHALLN
jgi:Transglutaminase-like superfamily